VKLFDSPSIQHWPAGFAAEVFHQEVKDFLFLLDVVFLSLF